MARTRAGTVTAIYRLKITLRGIRPSIWRRIEVPGNTRLDHLHLMFQAVMGWYNCHLHSFTIDGETYAMPDLQGELDFENERRFHLEEVVRREKARFLYTYDFGDNWEHEVRVERITLAEAGAKYPRCTGGARACPPEDVGSAWGYAEFLEAIRDPKHEQHESYLEWIGGEFDPEEFDLTDAEAAVKNFRSLQVDA